MDTGMELRTLGDESSTDRRPVQARLPKKLSPQEVAIFKRCEATIQKAVWGFAQAGEALNIIRSQRLYRAQYGTFRAYIRARWGFEPSRARQLIAASDVNRDLEGSKVKPINEGQLRPLARLDTETRRMVWEKATEQSQQPTKTEIEAVVAEVVESEEIPEDVKDVAREASDLIKLLEYMVNEARRMVQMVQGWNLAMGLETEQKEELRKQILKVRDSMKDVQMRLV